MYYMYNFFQLQPYGFVHLEIKQVFLKLHNTQLSSSYRIKQPAKIWRLPVLMPSRTWSDGVSSWRVWILCMAVGWQNLLQKRRLAKRWVSAKRLCWFFLCWACVLRRPNLYTTEHIRKHLFLKQKCIKMKICYVHIRNKYAFMRFFIFTDIRLVIEKKDSVHDNKHHFDDILINFLWHGVIFKLKFVSKFLCSYSVYLVAEMKLINTSLPICANHIKIISWMHFDLPYCVTTL